jgi:hypothetical protein
MAVRSGNADKLRLLEHDVEKVERALLPPGRLMAKGFDEDGTGPRRSRLCRD